MNEQHVQSPEQYIVPSQKELHPGETARFLEQNTGHPLKSAEEMRKLTGLDLPATMAIEFNEGSETHQLLVVPIERGKNEDFDADFLLVNPDLMAPDDPDSLATNVGFKGLRAHEGVKFGAGDDNINETVNARLGLHAGTSPNFRMQVDDQGKLHISVNPNSPQKIRLVQPVLNERQRGQAQAPTRIEQPTVPLTLQERLAPETAEHQGEQPTADQIFASPESFIKTLEDTQLSPATRSELMLIMANSSEREQVAKVTELWESKLGVPLQELLPDVQTANNLVGQLEVNIGMLLRASYNLNEELSIPHPDQYDLQDRQESFRRAAAELRGVLENAPPSAYGLIDKAKKLLAAEDTKAQLATALAPESIVDNPSKLAQLVESHVPEETLKEARLRVKDQLEEEPGFETWPARKRALHTLAALNSPGSVIESGEDVARVGNNLAITLNMLINGGRVNTDTINQLLIELAPMQAKAQAVRNLVQDLGGAFLSSVSTYR